VSELDRHPDRGNQPYLLATGWVSETDALDLVENRQIILAALLHYIPPPAQREAAVSLVEELRRAWCPPQ
jgi:hypothetical protein